MIKGVILLLVGMQSVGDTVTLDVSAALERGLDVSPTLAASRFRAEAASERAAQARAWPNPSLAVSAENVGQQSTFTGIRGTGGLEGQAVLEAPLLLGAQRSGPIRVAAARSRVAELGSVASGRRTALEILQSIGAFLRDQTLARTAREELSTLARIAQDLALQAEVGRAARGDAARAELARGMASTRLARRVAALATGSSDLARRLGYPASTAVRIVPQRCTEVDLARSETTDALATEVQLAQARLEEASGAVEVASSTKVPGILPQIGVRRTQGHTGLYLGLQSSLPLFDQGDRALDAARSDERAAEAELRDAEVRWDAATAAARRTLAALDEAGAGFDSRWFQSVEASVTAAEARYELGESTLAQLLDSRRARLQALEDYAAWQFEWWEARATVSWLEGSGLEATVLCTDPYRSAER